MMNTVTLKENAMLRVNPDLYNEWDFDKNKDLFPDIHEVTRGSNKKAWWKCKHHESYEQIIKTKVSNDNGCKVCNSRQLLVGFNDIKTTNPELAKLILNPEDATSYMEKSNSRIDWKCSNCNEVIKNKKISDVSNDGLSCPNCSDGISYPEKVMRNVLMSMGIEFEQQKTFEWANNKRYDFYIESLNMIIEVHGGQHVNGGFSTFNNGKTLDYEISNDNLKRELSIGNVDEYIEIDASKSEMNFIRNSITKSNISKLITFSDINWDEVELNSRNSISFNCLSIWNDGHKDIHYIGKELNIPSEMTRRYLLHWDDLGKCDYKANLKTKRKIQQLSTNGELVKVWNSIAEASMYFSNKKRDNRLYRALQKDDGRIILGFKWKYLND